MHPGGEYMHSEMADQGHASATTAGQPTPANAGQEVIGGGQGD